MPNDFREPSNLLHGRQVFLIKGHEDIDSRLGQLQAFIITRTKNEENEVKFDRQPIDIIPCIEMRDYFIEMDV